MIKLKRLQKNMTPRSGSSKIAPTVCCALPNRSVLFRDRLFYGGFPAFALPALVGGVAFDDDDAVAGFGEVMVVLKAGDGVANSEHSLLDFLLGQLFFE